jgi:hypothetical protein
VSGSTGAPPQGPPDPGAVSSPAPLRKPLWRRGLSWLIPPTSDRPRRPDGLLTAPGPDLLALGVALLMAVVAAAVFEHFALMAPVPPGGDEGTWLLNAYPYVGLGGTGQAPILDYPPASFPFLGLAVRITGSPLSGADLFAGATIIAIGVSFYELALSMVELRVVALLAEAAFFVQPDFQQLYYFGSYPNMFGLIFFFLALALGLRFLRSRRPLHLGLFWATGAVAVLSHALVAILLVEILVLVCVALLIYRRLPREFFGGVGLAGLAVFLGSGIGYYAVVPRLGFSPPNYITSSVLTASRSTSNLPSVLKPFYLEAISSAVRGSGFPLTATLTLQLLWGASLAIVAAVLVIRWWAPRLMTHRVLILAAWFLAMFLLALGTYYVGITTDYRRFAYMLYPTTILGGAFAGDLALTYLLRRPRPRGEPGLPPVVRGRRPLPPWRWRRWTRPQVLVSVIAAVVALLLLFSAYTYTVPGAQAFEAYFSGPGHDANFVSAMQAISNSPLSGSIYSASSLVDRWPSTLTERSVYEARAPTGYTYTPENLIEDELGNLLIDRQYTVTNGLVAASIPALDLAYFNSSLIYSLDSYGVPRQVYEVPPGSVTVTLAGGSATPAFGKTASSIPQIIAPANASVPTMELRYNDTGFFLLETITTPPGTSSMIVTFAATATGKAGVVAVSAKLSASSGNYDPVNQTGPASFTWFTNTTSGNYTSYGSAASGASITSLLPANNVTGKGGNIVLANTSSASNGTPTLALTITTSTPTASNTVTGFVGYITGNAILSEWAVRFILLYNSALSTGPQAAAFFGTVYGAVPFVQYGEWRVLVLNP